MGVGIIFFRGGQKWWNLVFTLWNWKTTFLADNFKIQEEAKAPLPSLFWHSWLWGQPASKMLNSKLSKQGQVVSMYCRILLLQRKHKLVCTKPSTAPHRGLRPQVEHRCLRIWPMCLAIAGVINQSETKNDISYCYSKKPHHIHYRWAHMNITPCFAHIYMLLLS